MIVKKMECRRLGIFLVRAWLVFALAQLSPASARAAEDVSAVDSDINIPVEVAGDRIDYLRAEKKIVAEGSVIVSYKELRMTCDKVEVLTDEKQAFAEGHVVFYRGPDSYRGDKVFYDFKTSTGSFPDGRVIDAPWYSHGHTVEQTGPEKIEVYDGTVTSCDLDRPHYDVKAKRLTVYIDDKIVARNVVFRVLGKPIFWWPYFTMSLKNRQPPFEINPGYSKKFGFYVLTAKGFSISEHISGKWHADYRSKRGFGAGLDINYQFNEDLEDQRGQLMGRGEIKIYGTGDKESPDPRPLTGSPYDDKNLKEMDRGRLSWKHESQLDPYTAVRVQWNELSDEYFLKDFFEREFRQEVSPESYINITRNTRKYGLLLDIQKRSNRFESTLERLPEIRFTWKTAELGETGIFYQNEETFSNLNKKSSRSGSDTDHTRLNSFQQLNYPRKFFHFDVNPNVNWEGTYWSRAVSGEENITRQVWGGGVDISTRFYRVFDVKGEVLGIMADKIRHLIEPSVKYIAKREVTRANISIQQLDSVDSRDVTDRLIYGIENRLQTKREIQGETRRVDIVSLSNFLTYDMDDSRIGGSVWTTLTNEIQFRPWEWMTLSWNGDWDMDRDVWSNSNTDMILHHKNFYLILGHRFLKKSSSELTLTADYWLNERWAVGTYWRHEFDRNRTEEYEFRLTRDLHDWLLDFGFNMRRNAEQDQRDFEVFVELTLKAFPYRTLKTGDRSTIARPRIGDTVSGADLGFDVGKFRRGIYRDGEGLWAEGA